MRSPKLIDTLIEGRTLQQRKKPGRKPRPKPLCEYPGCQQRVALHGNKHCSQSHAMLHNTLLRGTDKAPPAPKPAPRAIAPKKPTHTTSTSLIRSVPDYDLFAPIED